MSVDEEEVENRSFETRSLDDGKNEKLPKSLIMTDGSFAGVTKDCELLSWETKSQPTYMRVVELVGLS